MNPVGELDAPGVEGADYQLPAAAAFRHTFLPVPFLTTFRSFFKAIHHLSSREGYRGNVALSCHRFKASTV